MRQIHAEIADPRQLAGDDPACLAKVHLRVPRLVAERNKYLAAAQLCVRHIITNNRDAAVKTELIAQPFEFPRRRMALLGMQCADVLQGLVDGLRRPRQFPAVCSTRPARFQSGDPGRRVAPLITGVLNF